MSRREAVEVHVFSERDDRGRALTFTGLTGELPKNADDDCIVVCRRHGRHVLHGDQCVLHNAGSAEWVEMTTTVGSSSPDEKWLSRSGQVFLQPVRGVCQE